MCVSKSVVKKNSSFFNFLICFDKTLVVACLEIKLALVSFRSIFVKNERLRGFCLREWNAKEFLSSGSLQPDFVQNI